MKVMIFFMTLLMNQCSQQMSSMQLTNHRSMVSDTTLSSSIKYKIIQHGEGPEAVSGQAVQIYEKIQYPGGKVLFTFERPDPPVSFRIGANEVIEGVDKGVIGMRAGEIRELVLPPSLTKRAEYPEWLSADSTLIYTIEMVVVGQEGAIYQSTDFGVTWEDISEGLPNNLSVMALKPCQNGIMIGTGNGIYKRKSGKWLPTGELSLFTLESLDGLTGASSLFSSDDDTRITGVFPTKDGYYASVYKNGLFKSATGEAPWIAMGRQLEAKIIRDVLKTNNTMLVASESGLYKSDDNGDHWNKVLDNEEVTSFVESEGVILAGTFKGVLRSTDGGNHWEAITTTGFTQKLAVIDGAFVLISGPDKMMRSTDGGNNWKDWRGNLPEGKGIYDVVKAGGYFICSHANGLYRSGDDGVTWELVRPIRRAPLQNLEFSGSILNGVIYAIAVPGC